MENKGKNTRDRIMKVAEKIILGKGFSGTSIDEIIATAEITKGCFFYHFDGKNDLAVQLIKNYLQVDEGFFQGIFNRAESLTEDPVQQLLIALKLIAEAMSNLPGVHPGCLVATFTYESQLFDPEIRQLVAGGILRWRELFLQRFEAAKRASKPIVDFNSEHLADMLTVVIEGGIILSRSLDDPKALPNQILLYRDYVKTLFAR